MTTETGYLGLTLAHPFIAGASPLSHKLDTLHQLEDAGAAAVVLHSLFEEQVELSRTGRVGRRDAHDPRFASTLARFPEATGYPATPEQYTEHVYAATQALGIPVIASINGGSAQSWLTVAKDIEQAGAKALEVNLYQMVVDPRLGSAAVEHEWISMVRALRRILTIPLAVKVTPFFTAFGNMAHGLVNAGASGLVLFNRVYQTDIDIDTMTPRVHIELSTPQELLLRLRWVAALHGRISASLAVTGGVATPEDGIKALLAGADAVQLTSALLREGPAYMATMRTGLLRWMEAHHVDDLRTVLGRASLKDVADPLAFERATYLQTLTHWA